MGDKKKFTFKFTVEAYDFEDAYKELDDAIQLAILEQDTVASLVVQVDDDSEEDECACGHKYCGGRRNDS